MSDWHSEEDDRQVATCPQLGSTDRLEHAQVRKSVIFNEEMVGGRERVTTDEERGR